MDHSLLHPVVNVANDNSLVLFVAVVKAELVTMQLWVRLARSFFEHLIEWDSELITMRAEAQ
jgi:hypothetical protein